MNVYIAVALFLFLLGLKAEPSAQAKGGITVTQNEEQAYGLPTIVIFGDDSSDETVVPLKRMAVIDIRDMDALWDGLGIDTSNWLPTDPYGLEKGNLQEFPMLYAALGFIAFQREYKSGQLDQLIVECRRGKELINAAIAKRTAETIMDAAILQRANHGRLLVRAGICVPSDPASCPK